MVAGPVGLLFFVTCFQQNNIKVHRRTIPEENT